MQLRIQIFPQEWNPCFIARPKGPLVFFLALSPIILRFLRLNNPEGVDFSKCTGLALSFLSLYLIVYLFSPAQKTSSWCSSRFTFICEPFPVCSTQTELSSYLPHIYFHYILIGVYFISPRFLDSMDCVCSLFSLCYVAQYLIHNNV